jgi:hypothetical protein
LQEIESTGVGAILMDRNRKFKIPVIFADTVIIGARVSELRDDD